MLYICTLNSFLVYTGNGPAIMILYTFYLDEFLTTFFLLYLFYVELTKLKHNWCMWLNNAQYVPQSHCMCIFFWFCCFFDFVLFIIVSVCYEVMLIINPLFFYSVAQLWRILTMPYLVSRTAQKLQLRYVANYICMLLM